MTRNCQPVEPFDPAEGGPEYVFVKMADHIEARIRAGELPPGARLPGERALATEYGVSIGTGRRAVAELRKRWLIVTLPALGHYVASADALATRRRTLGADEP